MATNNSSTGISEILEQWSDKPISTFKFTSIDILTSPLKNIPSVEKFTKQVAREFTRGTMNPQNPDDAKQTAQEGDPGSMVNSFEDILSSLDLPQHESK